MNVVSVCSSVGGLDLGLHRAGHRTVLFCEADKWRRTILNRHFPGVPVHPDLEALTANDCPPCDLLAGGTPCQDLSVAGNRAGLAGDESRLFWDFAQLRIDLYDTHGCAWSLWENVAGALSSEDGWTLPDGPSLADALQGWPLEHCSPFDPTPDGRRYSACGDGVVAHVAEWIGLGFAGLVGGEA